MRRCRILARKVTKPPIAICLMEVDDCRRGITPAGFTPLLPAKSLQAKIDDAVIRKLYAIAEAAADRAEMHAIIGKQRDNWNHLFLHSVNSLALSASLMSGLACVGSDASSPHILAFKLSSVLLFAATSTVMLVVNKVQPSQLAEEQRNAARLWRKLEKEIQSKLSLQTPRESDVDAAMRKVLALDKAYPLPLLPGMLEKFPKKVEPTCWWPREEYKQSETTAVDEKYQTNYSNGWSKELEESMKGVAKVLQMKDQAEYVKVGKLVLNINKGFAIAGPVFAGMAAAAAGFIGLPATGSWPVLVTAVGGALAATVNTLEHGGQVGMVFELARNCAGFYKKLEEEIEESLEEREAEKRENGELFELKMALSLGRSVSDLKKFRSFASASGKVDEDVTEFAGKLQRCRAVLHASLSNLSPKAKIDDAVIRKLYAIAEAAADRAEMHAIIGKQRDNWNHLFLHSVNSLALSASLMSGLACVGSDASSPHVLAFKLSSVLLFAATSTVMLVVNKVQPSQLAEEQRNAARLWRKLEKEIQSKLSLQTPRESDVDASMRKVLALDKAYPLPLLPGMLEKFPKKVEPTCWWPRKEYKQSETTAIDEKYQTNYSNGWSKELEESMKGVAKVLQTKDQAEYVTVGKLVLNINKGFAIAGPVFAGMAAAAAGFIGLPATGSWPVLVTAVGGALAATVNTLEHGGQVGMVFELARNCAGFYKKLEEEIEESLEEREAEKRENGELFELKMALSLGRSVSDLRKFRSFASASGKVDEDVTEFAGKLF
uniref:Uncharacterized protein n=1 Tax=Ananas comosus var. bracteatus TaxID=296719 RepID=A0A6V7QR16_ANACO